MDSQHSLLCCPVVSCYCANLSGEVCPCRARLCPVLAACISQVKLATLVGMFDAGGRGLLGDVEVARLLRFARPTLSERQVERCLLQVGGTDSYAVLSFCPRLYMCVQMFASGRLLRMSFGAGSMSASLGCLCWSMQLDGFDRSAAPWHAEPAAVSACRSRRRWTRTVTGWCHCRCVATCWHTFHRLLFIDSAYLKSHVATHDKHTLQVMLPALLD